MTGWTEFILAMAAFLGSHFLPRLGDLRGRMIRAVGRRLYFSAYGALSLALLIWVIVAAGRAPYVELWSQWPWMRWVPNLAMPVAAVLAAIGLGIRQPYTLGGRRRAGFDARDPGAAAVVRHPLLLSLAVWAAAHMVPNGDLAHVILFGGFALLALGAMPVFDLRARRSEGAAFFEATSPLSLAPFADPVWRRRNGRALVLRAGVGLALWAGALLLHTWVIGVSPYPV